MAKTMRYSRQRERIYEYLLEATEHPSAERIYTELKEELPELSLGTVYRNLKLLEELGRVRRVAGVQGNERYDAICADHAHFICRSCGAVRDLPAVSAETLRQSVALEEGYEAERLDMLVTGSCPNCHQPL